MELRELKIEDYFIMKTSRGRANAQVYKVKSLPYYSLYEKTDVVNCHNMKKGTTLTKPTTSIVIRVSNWINYVEMK